LRTTTGRCGSRSGWVDGGGAWRLLVVAGDGCARRELTERDGAGVAGADLACVFAELAG
jgi:hypothetical protein